MNTKVMTLIKRITLIVLGVALLLSAGLVFLTSYTSWNDYYKQMLIKKERFDKEREPEVTVMNGIRVSVKDGVGFFKNGRASADKSNFVVEGLYTIGNEITKRDYEEEISSDNYTLTAPEDFVKNGGEITFNYKKIEQKVAEDGSLVYELDEKGEPKKDKDGREIPVMVTVYDFTETMNIELLDVKLDHIEVTKNPYLVAYAEGEKFVSEGMAVNAVYNDGTKIENISVALLDISKDELTADTKSVKLAYKYGEADDEVIHGEVPVSVMLKDEFTNGKLESITVVGGISLVAGESISSVKPVVYGRYSSGNYIRLKESQYTLSGFKGAAEFGRVYNVYVSSTEFPDMMVRRTVYPVKSLYADEAVISGATAYNGYVKDFDNGDYIEFTYNSATATVANLYLYMSNGYLVYENGAFTSLPISINDFASVSINGKTKGLSYAFEKDGPFAYASEALGSFKKINLGSYTVQAGNNIVRVTFKDSVSGLTSAFGQHVAGAVEKLEIAMEDGFDGSYEYIGDYVRQTIETGETLDFNVERILEWGKLGTDASDKAQCFAQASVTDGVYMYVYTNLNVQGVIIKYDMKNGTADYTASFPLVSHTKTKLFIKDGYVYTVSKDDVLMRWPLEFTGNGTAKPEYVPSMSLGYDMSEIKMAHYNEEKDLYALYVGSSIRVVDEDHNEVASFTPKAVTAMINGAKWELVNIEAISGDDEYIYLHFSTNGLIAPCVAVYIWTGEFIGTFQPDCSITTFGRNDKSKSVVYSIAAYKGAIYYTAINWENGDNSAIFKVTVNIPKETQSLGNAVKNNESDSVETKMVVGYDDFVGKTLNYALASDGENLFAYAMRKKIVRYNIKDKTTVETASLADYTGIETAMSMFIKDGYVYVYTGSKHQFLRVKTDFSAGETIETLEMNFGDITAAYIGVTYNDNHGFAVWTLDNKLYFFDKSGNQIGTSVSVPASARAVKYDDTTTTIGQIKRVFCDDDYVYLNYGGNGCVTPSVQVVSWEGESVGSVVIPNPDNALGSNSGFIAGITTFGKDVYFTILRWSPKDGTALFRTRFIKE